MCFFVVFLLMLFMPNMLSVSLAQSTQSVFVSDISSSCSSGGNALISTSTFVINDMQNLLVEDIGVGLQIPAPQIGQHSFPCSSQSSNTDDNGNIFWYSDMTASLISPSGRTLDFMMRVCIQSGFFIYFDDNNIVPISYASVSSASLSNPLKVKPSAKFALFKGDILQGTWTMNIYFGGHNSYDYYGFAWCEGQNFLGNQTYMTFVPQASFQPSCANVFSSPVNTFLSCNSNNNVISTLTFNSSSSSISFMQPSNSIPWQNVPKLINSGNALNMCRLTVAFLSTSLSSISVSLQFYNATNRFLYAQFQKLSSGSSVYVICPSGSIGVSVSSNSSKIVNVSSFYVHMTTLSNLIMDSSCSRAPFVYYVSGQFSIPSSNFNGWNTIGSGSNWNCGDNAPYMIITEDTTFNGQLQSNYGSNNVVYLYQNIPLTSLGALVSTHQALFSVSVQISIGTIIQSSGTTGSSTGYVYIVNGSQSIISNPSSSTKSSLLTLSGTQTSNSVISYVTTLSSTLKSIYYILSCDSIMDANNYQNTNCFFDNTAVIPMIDTVAASYCDDETNVIQLGLPWGSLKGSSQPTLQVDYGWVCRWIINVTPFFPTGATIFLNQINQVSNTLVSPDTLIATDSATFSSSNNASFIQGSTSYNNNTFLISTTGVASVAYLQKGLKTNAGISYGLGNFYLQYDAVATPHVFSIFPNGGLGNFTVTISGSNFLSAGGAGIGIDVYPLFVTLLTASKTAIVCDMSAHSNQITDSQIICLLPSGPTTYGNSLVIVKKGYAVTSEKIYFDYYLPSIQSINPVGVISSSFPYTLAILGDFIANSSQLLIDVYGKDSNGTANSLICSCIVTSSSYLQSKNLSQANCQIQNQLATGFYYFIVNSAGTSSFPSKVQLQVIESAPTITFLTPHDGNAQSTLNINATFYDTVASSNWNVIVGGKPCLQTTVIFQNVAAGVINLVCNGISQSVISISNPPFSVPVTLTVFNISSVNSYPFLIVARVNITSFLPKSGDSGITLTVYGTNFPNTTAEFSLFVGGEVCPIILGTLNITNKTSNVIECTIPPGTGNVSVTATLATEPAISISSTFHFTNTPVISSLSPIGGSTAGSQIVTIIGVNLGSTGNMASTTITIGSYFCTNLVFLTSNNITCVTSPGYGSNLLLTFIAAGGVVGTFLASPIYYSYGMAELSSLNPSTTPVNLPTSLTITGVNFGDPSVTSTLSYELILTKKFSSTDNNLTQQWNCSQGGVGNIVMTIPNIQLVCILFPFQNTLVGDTGSSTSNPNNFAISGDSFDVTLVIFDSAVGDSLKVQIVQTFANSTLNQDSNSTFPSDIANFTGSITSNNSYIGFVYTDSMSFNYLSPTIGSGNQIISFLGTNLPCSQTFDSNSYSCFCILSNSLLPTPIIIPIALFQSEFEPVSSSKFNVSGPESNLNSSVSYYYSCSLPPVNQLQLQSIFFPITSIVSIGIQFSVSGLLNSFILGTTSLLTTYSSQTSGNSSFLNYPSFGMLYVLSPNNLSSSSFVYVEVPEIVSICPSILALNANKTINVFGSGFDRSPNLSCLINGVVWKGVFQSSFQVSCNVIYPAAGGSFSSLIGISNDGINFVFSGNNDQVIFYGQPAALSILVQPSPQSFNNGPLLTQPVINVLDENNQISQDPIDFVQVTATFQPNPLSTSANTIVTALNGVATFSGLLFVGIPGEHYNILFTAVDSSGNSIASILSTSITIPACPNLLPNSILETNGTHCECNAGTFSSKGSCNLCAIDSYQTYVGNYAQCTQCPLQSGTKQIGSTNATDCLCEAGYYRPVTEAASPCIDCHPYVGISCPGGYEIDTNPGYWRSSPDSFHAHACVISAACKGGANSTCIQGYKGLLCSVCEEPGYGRSGQECEKCLPAAANWFLLFMFGIIAVLFFAWLVYESSKTNKGSVSVCTKVLLNHLQVLSFIGNYQVIWPIAIERLFQLGNIVTVNSQMFNVQCALQLTFYQGHVIILCSPLIVFAIVFVFYGIRWIRKYEALTESQRKDKSAMEEMKVKTFRNIHRATLVILYLFHAILAKQSLSALNCVHIENQVVLNVDMSVSCKTDTWKHYAIASALYFVIYCLGGVIILSYFLYHNREKFTEDYKSATKKYQFLFYGYREHRYYWETIVIVRKLLIVTVGVFLGTSQQIFCGILIIYSSILLEGTKRPFRDERINKMEQYSLWSLLSTLILSLLYINQKHTSATTPTNSFIFFLSLITLLINILVLVVFCVGLLVMKREESEWFQTVTNWFVFPLLDYDKEKLGGLVRQNSFLTFLEADKQNKKKGNNNYNSNAF